MRARKYFALIARRMRPLSSAATMRAVPENFGPVILPRIVQGAILTCGLFRRRFTLPSLPLVMKQSLSFSSANQTGVYTGTPLLRKVATEI